MVSPYELRYISMKRIKLDEATVEAERIIVKPLVHAALEGTARLTAAA